MAGVYTSRELIANRGSHIHTYKAKSSACSQNAMTILVGDGVMIGFDPSCIERYMKRRSNNSLVRLPKLNPVPLWISKPSKTAVIVGLALRIDLNPGRDQRIQHRI